ncbi:MAG: disulfide bond formation protein B [Alphaproteobacteria bacterium]
MFNIKNYFINYILVSILILSGAYFIEYGLGQKPCILCLYQRIPYYIIILISFLGIKFKNHKNFFHLFISLIFFTSFILASYHSGVEQGIFSGLKGCQSNLSKVAYDITELKEAIFANNQPTCTHADFKILSISLAGWNAIISIIFAYYSFKNFKGNKYEK